jgi:hypothetical protein
MKSLVVMLGVLITAVAVGLMSGDNTDPRLQAGFGMPVTLASLDAIDQDEAVAEIDEELPKPPEPQPTLAKPKSITPVKSGGSSGNIVVEHVPQYSYASCGSTGSPAVVHQYGTSGGYTQSAYCPPVSYSCPPQVSYTVVNNSSNLTARRTPVRTVVRGVVKGTARVVAGTARTATGTTRRIVAAPVKAVSNYRARWTYPGTIQQHLASDHGISTAGKTQSQLLVEHDAIHDQIGPVSRTSAPIVVNQVQYSQPVQYTERYTQPAVVTSVVRSVQAATQPRSNCPDGRCPVNSHFGSPPFKGCR